MQIRSTAIQFTGSVDKDAFRLPNDPGKRSLCQNRSATNTRTLRNVFWLCTFCSHKILTSLHRS